jgi:hypothetical protein
LAIVVSSIVCGERILAQIVGTDITVRIALVTLLLAAASIALAIQQRWVNIPDHLNPWAALEIGAPPNFLTRYKLSRLTGDRELCTRILQTAEMDYEPLPDQQTGEACGLYSAVRINATTAAVGAPFSLTCRSAVALALWERHALQPAAEIYFQSRVQKLEHFGSYSCRNVYNRPEGTRSRHATAEALDVAGFVLENGRRIRVLRDWPEDSPESRFLHDVRHGACKFFDGVLSPDYNAAHRDHLHLDRGPYRVCR